jgi:hypothetical protein
MTIFYDSLLKEIDQILKANQSQIPQSVDPDDDVPLSEMAPLQRSEKTPLINIQVTIESKIVTISLSSTCFALKLVSQLIKQHDLSDRAHWTLFEVDTQLKIERPMRDWEKISVILENSCSRFELRQYPEKYSISAKVSYF